jgi:hypothetical protein
VNLSSNQSRLVFPRATPDALAGIKPAPYDSHIVDAALAQEAALGYYVPSGKYWKEEGRFDVAAIDALDALWLTTIPDPQTTP